MPLTLTLSPLRGERGTEARDPVANFWGAVLAPVLAIAGPWLGGCSGVIVGEGDPVGEAATAVPVASAPIGDRERGDPGSSGAAPGATAVAPGASPSGSAAAAPAAGCGPIPRRIWKLTRSQYNHTVAALGIPNPGLPAEPFAPDPRGKHGFRNLAGHLDMPASKVDQLFGAAVDLGSRAGEAAATLAPCLAAAAPDAACAESFVRGFGARAFRRPLRDEEAGRYLDLYRREAQAHGKRGAIEQVVTAMLMSPRFLYRWELGRAVAGTSRYELDPLERASALSYLFIDGPPDPELLSAAQEGRLAAPRDVEAQARRLLGVEAAGRSVGKLFVEGFELEQLPKTQKDGKLFPQFDARLATDMLREAERFSVDVLLRADGRIETLLAGSYSLLNARLATLYGLKGVDGDSFRKVTLPPEQRAGLLTMPALMTELAAGTDTDIVHRGLFVRERLLCETVPPPPGNVNAVPPPPKPGLTRREEMDLHSKDPTCAGCHRFIDPLGAAFEHYDPIGRYRTTDDGKPIDAAGTLHGQGGYADVRFTNAVDLSRKLVGMREVSECLGRTLYQFATGRPDGEADQCRLRDLARAVAASGGSLRELLVALAAHETFFVRGPEATRADELAPERLF